MGPRQLCSCSALIPEVHSDSLATERLKWRLKRLFQSSFATAPGARVMYFPKPASQKPDMPLGLTDRCRG